MTGLQNTPTKYRMASLASSAGNYLLPPERKDTDVDLGGPNPYQYTYEVSRPSGPSYDSREALQLSGRYVPYAAGGPVQEMSDRNAMETLMANGGQMFAEGGKTEGTEAKPDVAKGMTGASADAFRYLMGQAAQSPATIAAQQNMQAVTPTAPVAPVNNTLRPGMEFDPDQPYAYTFNPATGLFVEGERKQRPAPPPPRDPGYDAGANGGLMSLAAGGGISHLGDYSDGGRLLKGPGDGVSDSIPATIADKRPARLADGEFVVPARIVSELGNGSTEAGARKLYAMMDRVQNARKKSIGKKKVAVDSRADKLLPA
jgi:hypothetical protein